jgi:hypothetical protein
MMLFIIIILISDCKLKELLFIIIVIVITPLSITLYHVAFFNITLKMKFFFFMVSYI